MSWGSRRGLKKVINITEFKHVPVMLGECLSALDIKPGGTYADGTTGGAGHSVEIAKRLEGGRLFCFDKDPDAIAAAGRRLKDYPCAELIRADFSDMKEILQSQDIKGLDGVLLDLGISSYQIDTPERGFSYQSGNDAPLDMRMSGEGYSAEDFINGEPEEVITKVLFEYGEEKYARNISRAIIRERAESRIRSTLRLAEIVSRAVPAKARRNGHPARKTFQAVRIFVNRELEILDRALKNIFSFLNPEGNLAVISFHSLEDRIVKRAFEDLTRGCVCPPDFPVCVCGRKPEGELLWRKALIASEAELETNRRSRSAKLRAIKKL
jgi:16S rRNA (cytosine1402-N4)-methyltransferase